MSEDRTEEMSGGIPHTHGGTDAPECTPYGIRCAPRQRESASETLTPAGQFVYERLTMADGDRSPDDPVRRGKYEPCCEEHKPGRVCILPVGHIVSRSNVGPGADDHLARSSTDTSRRPTLPLQRHNPYDVGT